MKYRENSDGDMEFLITEGEATYRVVPKEIERVR